MRFSALLLCLLLLSCSLVSSQSIPELSEQPIAYIGHGAMFDRNGKEIQPTNTFVRQATRFYRDAVLKMSDADTRSRYNKLTNKYINAHHTLNTSRELFVVESVATELSNASHSGEVASIRGKLALLDKYVLGAHKPSPVLNKMMSEVGLESFSLEKFEGSDYEQTCAAAGVPTAPDWGSAQWIKQGSIKDVFISKNYSAEVYTYHSHNPEGVCIALPRIKGQDIMLLGIICQGKQTSNACFWDNQNQKGNNVPIPVGTAKPLSEFAGGPALEKGDGGNCTGCHAGENAYIIHPGTNLGLPKLSGLPLRADGWYKPLVAATWPQNPGPSDILSGVPSTGKCTICHTQQGPGGRFPDLSALKIVDDEPSGYCKTILPSAISFTMPPGSPPLVISKTVPLGTPKDPSYAPHAKALLDACR